MLRALPCIATAALLATSCRGANPFRKVERGIARELTTRIGPAERYEVRVSRSGGNLVAGRIPWVEVRGIKVRAANVLTVEEVKVRLDGVRFDREKRAITEVEDSRFTASLTPEALTEYIRRRKPDLRDVRLRIERGTVIVDATPTFLGVGIPISVEGQPRVRGDTRLDFDAGRVAVLRLGLPELAVRRLEEIINPIVDVEELKLPIRLSGVGIASDHVLVTGVTTFSAPP